ncbi:putative carboxypeptidase [Tropheryma whipplei TW08/27]|nr:putative carboxypeptidase [Tropheryma whipplei TW08/27]
MRLYRPLFYACLLLSFLFFILSDRYGMERTQSPHTVDISQRYFADSSLSLLPHLLDPDIKHIALDVDGHPELKLRKGNKGKHPIASISKVILALMLIERYSLSELNDGPNITYDTEDVSFFRNSVKDGDSYAPVYAGLTLTLKQSLIPLMLPSANNYATSLVKHLYGKSYPKFAREWLDKNGLYNTDIYEASGLDDRNVSTTDNLIVLAKKAYSNPVLRGIMRLKEASIPNIGLVRNTNKALGINGIDGIKTGSSPAAKSNLLFTAAIKTKNGLIRIYGVFKTEKSYASLYGKLDTLLKRVRAYFHQRNLLTD